MSEHMTNKNRGDDLKEMSLAWIQACYPQVLLAEKGYHPLHMDSNTIFSFAIIHDVQKMK